MRTLIAFVLAVVAGNAWTAPHIEGAPLPGLVLESIDAGTYTYLRLRTDDGEVWAAIMATKIPDGARIVIRDPTMMTQFESKALHRTFDSIYFGSVVEVEPVGTITKATDPKARTVSEVFAQKTKLNGNIVVVRGKIVKFSSGIMGRNWLHVQDGTGSAADSTNDLLVTTQQVAGVGDVVTVKGLVRTNVDYGAGYAYAVIVDDAAVIKDAVQPGKVKTAQQSSAGSQNSQDVAGVARKPAASVN